MSGLLDYWTDGSDQLLIDNGDGWRSLVTPLDGDSAGHAWGIEVRMDGEPNRLFIQLARYSNKHGKDMCAELSIHMNHEGVIVDLWPERGSGLPMESVSSAFATWDELDTADEDDGEE